MSKKIREFYLCLVDQLYRRIIFVSERDDCLSFLKCFHNVCLLYDNTFELNFYFYHHESALIKNLYVNFLSSMELRVHKWLQSIQFDIQFEYVMRGLLSTLASVAPAQARRTSEENCFIKPPMIKMRNVRA